MPWRYCRSSAAFVWSTPTTVPRPVATATETSTAPASSPRPAPRTPPTYASFTNSAFTLTPLDRGSRITVRFRSQAYPTMPRMGMTYNKTRRPSGMLPRSITRAMTRIMYARRKMKISEVSLSRALLSATSYGRSIVVPDRVAARVDEPGFAMALPPLRPNVSGQSEVLPSPHCEAILHRSWVPANTTTDGRASPRLPAGATALTIPLDDLFSKRPALTLARPAGAQTQPPPDGATTRRPHADRSAQSLLHAPLGRRVLQLLGHVLSWYTEVEGTPPPPRPRRRYRRLSGTPPCAICVLCEQVPARRTRLA